MKAMTRILAGGTAFFIAACTVPAPTKDTTPPEITVIVSGVRGRNVFRSIDGVQEPGNDCIKVAATPVQLTLIAGDAGGIDAVALRTFPARVIPESVDVAPRAPESSFSIRPGGDGFTITLTPPSSTTVRTGATAIFEVDGTLPFEITGDARDRAGHVTNFPGFSIRSLETPFPCRNDK